MRFAQAHTAQKDEVGFGLDKFEAKVVVHLETVNPGGPVPAKLLQGFDDGEARQPNAAFGGAVASLLRLAFREPGQGVDMRPRLLSRLGGELRLVLRDKGEF
jgi:hypothetical protein